MKINYRAGVLMLIVSSTKNLAGVTISGDMARKVYNTIPRCFERKILRYGQVKKAEKPLDNG